MAFQCAICSLLLAGCNDDVFVDGPIPPEKTTATIDGDGGRISVKASADRLERIELSLTQWIRPVSLTYISESGDTVSPQTPASDIRRIVFETDLCMLELIREKDLLTVCSRSNAAGRNLEWTVGLSYEYGYKTINVTSLPGKPLKLVSVNYGSIFDTESRTRENGLHIYNNSDNTYEDIFFPYLNMYPSVRVEPQADWLYLSTVKMPVPVCDRDGVWSLSKTPCEIRLGTTNQFQLPYRDYTESITVPPHFSGRAVTTVCFAEAETTGRIHVLNQAIGREFDIPFAATASYPISHTPVRLIPDTPGVARSPSN